MAGTIEQEHRPAEHVGLSGSFIDRLIIRRRYRRSPALLSGGLWLMLLPVRALRWAIKKLGWVYDQNKTEMHGALVLSCLALAGAGGFYLSRQADAIDAKRDKKETELAQFEKERLADIDRLAAEKLEQLEAREKRMLTEIEAREDVRVAYAIDTFRRRQEIHREFAQGIAQNLQCLQDMRAKALWLAYVQRVPGEQQYLDGRSFADVAKALEEQTNFWQTECPHFTALCERARYEFDPDGVARIYIDAIRVCFDILLEVRHSRASVRSGIAKLQAELDKLESVPPSNPPTSTHVVPQLDEVRDDLIELVLLMNHYDDADREIEEKLSSEPDGATRPSQEAAIRSEQERCTWYLADRLVRLCARAADRTYLSAVRAMGDELAAEPLAQRARELKILTGN